jgi:glucokinase-like ROK family protein
LLTDFSAHVLAEFETTFDIKEPPKKCLSEINQHVHNLLRDHNLSLSDIMAVGLGVPGPINMKLGGVSAPPIMPGWDSFPIRSYLEEMWGISVALGNDAEFGALGEWAYGAGRGERNLAYIKVGSGVGAGLLLDGQIYRGATGCAGEIGHITILENGPLCSCGNHGCLESLAGGNAIAWHAQEAVRVGRRTQLASLPSNEAVTARHVADAARKGDLVAQQIVSTSGAYLGLAIASMVNIFNPGMIVIGGGVSQMGDLLLDPIRQAVRDRSLLSAAKVVRVSSAILGRRSTSMGAVVQAINLALDRLTQS